jgi:HD-GYP domain-containing protein (c-di-GMP phosphodiesterase class II)
MKHRELDHGQPSAPSNASARRSSLPDDERRAYVATIAILADAVQAKDPYTHGHCEQVSQYARVAAERLGLPENELRVTCYAALPPGVLKTLVAR